MVECLACHEPIPKSSALIRGGLGGDACTEAFYCCPSCGQYTLAIYKDSFFGKDSVSLSGPLSPAQTEPKLAIIARCPDQLNRNCVCEAHRAYFGAWLDDIWRGAG